MRNKWLNKSCYFDIFVLLFAVVFSSWLMFGTFNYENGVMLIGSKAWSDFGAHIPLIRSFSLGNNLPAEYPFFPGEPIKYHFLFYYLVALLEKVGFNIAWAMNIVSIFGFSLLLWMIYKIAKLIFGNKKAGLLAILLFLFNGTLSFLELFKDKTTLSWDLIETVYKSKKFLSFGPWDKKIVSAFWNLNIYTNQRHLTLSFALILLVLYPVFVFLFKEKNILNKWWFIFLCLSLAFFPILHQAGYAILIIFLLLSFFFFPTLLKQIGKVYIFAIFLSLPVFFSVDNTAAVRLHFAYLAEERNISSAITYWFYNLGFYSVLLPVIFLMSDTKKRKLLFIFCSFFLLANVFWLSTDLINNHKLINFFMIGMNIYTAGFLVNLFKKSLIYKLLVPFLLLLLTLSGIIDFFPIKNDPYFRISDYKKLHISQWIMKNTAKDSVFLMNTYLYNPASIAGRKIFLDYGYFAWSLGYQDRARRKQLPLLFSANASKRTVCYDLYKNDIDYVILSPQKGDLEGIDPKTSVIYTKFLPVFKSKENYSIWDVKQMCSNYFGP